MFNWILNGIDYRKESEPPLFEIDKSIFQLIFDSFECNW